MVKIAGRTSANWQKRPCDNVLKRRLITVGVLFVAGATVLLAVPDLRHAADQASSINVLWLIGAVTLELASCVSFLAIFRRFFAELPAPEARRLAWIEMGSGALLPGGGVGSLAAGGMLLRRGGMSTQEIIERSSGLFFLTSGTNVLALEGAAALLALGLGGAPDRVSLATIPAAIGIAGVAIAVTIPRSRWHRSGRSRALRAVVGGIRQAERELIRPHWRLLGALGYLGFDIAVLGLTCAGVGHPIGVPALVLAYIIGYAANALPVPGGIGVLEGGLVGALALYGAPVTSATAAVLIYHTIAFWIPSLGGAIAYALTATSRRTVAASRSVDVLERSSRSCDRSWPELANSIPRRSSNEPRTRSENAATT
jgi:uncharacterized membrane protein YbhN (UPF0104 family)